MKKAKKKRNPSKPCVVCKKKTTMMVNKTHVCPQHADEWVSKGKKKKLVPYDHPVPTVIDFRGTQGIMCELNMVRGTYLADIGKIVGVRYDDGDVVVIYACTETVVRDLTLNMSREQFHARIRMALKHANEHF